MSALKTSLIFKVEDKQVSKIGTPVFWVLSTSWRNISSVAGEESPVNTSVESLLTSNITLGESLAKFYFWNVCVKLQGGNYLGSAVGMSGKDKQHNNT